MTSTDMPFSIPTEVESSFHLRTSHFIGTQRPWLDLYGVRLKAVPHFGSASSRPFVDPALIHRCLPDELLYEWHIWTFCSYSDLGHIFCGAKLPYSEVARISPEEENHQICDGKDFSNPFVRKLAFEDGKDEVQKVFDRCRQVFARMTPYSLGRAVCVCRKWKYTIRNPVFWRSACLKAWQMSGALENHRIVQSIYEGSWKKMWLLRPRVRTDGLYVSRNTYVRVGVAEWKVTNPVHVVCYYRYIRFYPSGRFLYKNSSQKVKEVAKFMNFRAAKADGVFSGHYTLNNDQVDAALLYPGLRPTVLRIRLRVRGTVKGANNRLDLISLVTSGVTDTEVNDPDADMLGVVEGWQEDETHNPDVPAVSHRRGLTPFVFVPFEEAETSVLNLPVDKMDYFVPG